MSSPDFIRPDGDDLIRDGADAITQNADAAEALVAEMASYQGPMTMGSSFDDYARPGVRTVGTGTLADSLTAGPYPGAIGALRVDVTEYGQVMHDFRDASGGLFARERPALSTTWTPWRQVYGSFVRGTFVGGENADGYTGGFYRGQWSIPQAAIDIGVNGLPANVPGLLDVLSPTGAQRLQMYISTLEERPRMWLRASSTPNGPLRLEPWIEVTGNSGATTARDPGQANHLHVEAFRRRRGGTIGTGGKAAVALRFDHFVNAFQANIEPLLHQYGLPSSMAMLPYELDPSYTPGSTGITWADIQQMSLETGVEMWSHSYTHADAPSESALHHEIVESRAELMAQMPEIIIEGWMMVGVGGTYYDGFGPIDRPEKFMDTIAGRLIMSTYAVSSGHMGGYHRPLTGHVQQGQAHMAIESLATADDAIAAITEAQDTATGLVLMSHPNAFGQSGRMPLAELERLLAHIATERDAGRLAVLTVGGLSVADTGSTNRHDLVINPTFENGLSRWSASGWTTTADGTQSPATGAVLRQSQSLRQRTWALGSPREVLVKVRSAAGADVSVRAATSNFGSLDVTRTFEIPAGSTWATLRLPIVLPHNVLTSPAVTLTLEVSAASGQTIEVAGVHCLAV